MGYYIEQEDSNFFLERESYGDALKAVKLTALEEEKMAGAASSGGKVFARYYGFVDMNYYTADTLAEALEDWRWQVSENETGIIGINFIGQKYTGDMKVVFEAIAPFVKDGSFIKMRGEDGMEIKWEFNNGKVQELFG